MRFAKVLAFGALLSASSWATTVTLNVVDSYNDRINAFGLAWDGNKLW